MPGSRPTSLACAALLAATALACGEGEGQSSYREHVERRCTAYKEAREAAARRVDDRLGGKSPDELAPGELRRVAPALGRVQRITARVVADLKALPRPAEGRSALAEAFEHADAGVAAEAKGVRAAQRGDAEAMLAALAETGEEFSAANRAGEPYGLKACG